MVTSTTLGLNFTTLWWNFTTLWWHFTILWYRRYPRPLTRLGAPQCLPAVFSAHCQIGAHDSAKQVLNASRDF